MRLTKSAIQLHIYRRDVEELMFFCTLFQREIVEKKTLSNEIDAYFCPSYFCFILP